LLAFGGLTNFSLKPENVGLDFTREVTSRCPRSKAMSEIIRYGRGGKYSQIQDINRVSNLKLEFRQDLEKNNMGAYNLRVGLFKGSLC
jgi:hypothetical protein